MSAFIRNFEIIPSLSSYIVDVDLGTASVPLCGIVNFASFSELTSFKIKNAAFEYIENIRNCSKLTVFDMSDSVLTLNTVISCLSAFSDRKAITPELTGNVYLTGFNMPILSSYTEEGTLDYEFARLYKFLTDKPNAWNVAVNKQPLYLFADNDQTLTITTTGTNSAYVIVNSNVSAFNFKVNGYDGMYLNSYYSASALSACFLTLTGTSQLTADNNIIYAGQNITLSSINGALHTFYFFNTGSFLLGIGSKSTPLRPIDVAPLIIPNIPTIYAIPPRYGYIDGINKKTFNVNTLNRQTTYVILNTAIDNFSLTINETGLLSAQNVFYNTANTLSASYITLSGKQNLSPASKKLSYLSSANLTGASSEIYNFKYFVKNNKITLGIAQTGIEILDPSNYYDNILFTSVTVSAAIILPTQLPPEAQ